MVPVEFAEAGRRLRNAERGHRPSTLRIETVDGRDWLQLMLSGVSRKLQADNEMRTTLDAITDAIRRQSERPGSQIRQFLDFLEDEAMARVQYAGVHAHHGSCGRSEPALRLQELCASGCVRRSKHSPAVTRALPLDVSSVYGVMNNTDLADQLRKAMFSTTCLPVWCEGSVQLFERRIDPEQNQPTVREVSYRFRVNGTKPETRPFGLRVAAQSP
jgi:hypothetical protein